MRIYKVLPTLIVLAALPAEATTAYYCDPACGGNTEAAFDTAFGALLTAGFVSSGTVTFTGEISGVTVFDVGSTQADFTGFNGVNPSTLNVVGSQLRNTSSGTGTGILIGMPPGIFAFGAHITQSGSNPKPWFFELPGVGNISVVLSSSSTTFVGVISDLPLVDHQLRAAVGGNFLYIDNFSTLSMAETPEGPTFLLLGMGLIVLPLLKWKRRARHAVRFL